MSTKSTTGYFQTEYDASNKQWLKTLIDKSAHGKEALRREITGLRLFGGKIATLLCEQLEDGVRLQPISDSDGQYFSLADIAEFLKENRELVTVLANRLQTMCKILKEAKYCHYRIEPETIVIPGVVDKIGNACLVSFSSSGEIGESVPEWFKPSKYYVQLQAKPGKYEASDDILAARRIIFEAWVGQNIEQKDFVDTNFDSSDDVKSLAAKYKAAALPENLLEIVSNMNSSLAPAADALQLKPVVAASQPQPSPANESADKQPALAPVAGKDYATPFEPRKGAAKLKIGILGRQAAGKTSYIMALYDALGREGKSYFEEKPTLKEYFVTVAPSSKEPVEKMWQKARKNDLAGTGSLKEHTFFVNQTDAKDPVGALVFPDWIGELLNRLANKSELTEQEQAHFRQIDAFLNECDGFIFTLPLVGADGQSITADEMAVNDLNHFFQNWKRFSHRTNTDEIPIALMLTKKDLQGALPEHPQKYLEDNFPKLLASLKPHRWSLLHFTYPPRPSWQAFFVDSHFDNNQQLNDPVSVAEPFHWLMGQVQYLNSVRKKRTYVKAAAVIAVLLLLFMGVMNARSRVAWSNFHQQYSEAALPQRIELVRQELNNKRFTEDRLKSYYADALQQIENYFTANCDEMRTEIDSLTRLFDRLSTLLSALESYQQQRVEISSETVRNKIVEAFSAGQDRILQALKSSDNDIPNLLLTLDEYLEKLAGADEKIRRDCAVPVQQKWLEFSFNLLQNSSKSKQMASAEFLALAQKHKQKAVSWKIPVSKEFEALFKDAVSAQLNVRKNEIESEWKVSRTNGTPLDRTRYLTDIDSFSKDYPEQAGEIASIAHDVRTIDGFFRNLPKEKEIIKADFETIKDIKKEFTFLLDRNELAKINKTISLLGKIESSFKAQKQKSLPERLKAYEQLDKDIKESENQAHLSSQKQESDDIIATVKADPASLATKEKWLEDVNSEHFAGLKEEIAVLTKRLNSFMDGFSKTETVSISKEEYEKLLSEVQAYSSSDANRLKAGYESAQKAAQNWIADKIAEFGQISEDKDLQSAFNKFRTAFKSIDSHPAGKAVEIQSAWMKASQKLFKRLSEDTVLSLEKKQNMIDDEKPFKKAYKEIGDAKKYIEESDLNEFKNKFSDAFRDSSELPWPPATIIPQEAIDNWAKEPLEKIKREIQKYLASEIEKDFEDKDLERWKSWAKFLTVNKKQNYLVSFPLQGVLKYLATDFENYYRSGDSSSYDLLSQKLIFAATEKLYRDELLKIRLISKPSERATAISNLGSKFVHLIKDAIAVSGNDRDKLSKQLVIKDIIPLYNGKVSGNYTVEVTPSKSSKICPGGVIWDFEYNNFVIQFRSEKPFEIQTKQFEKKSNTYTYTRNFSQKLDSDVGFKIRFAVIFFNDEKLSSGWEKNELEIKNARDEDSTYIFGVDAKVKFKYEVVFD